MLKCKRMKKSAFAILVVVWVLLCLGGGAYAMSSPPPETGATTPTSKFEAPATDADWPTFHGNSARDGFSSAKEIKPPLSVKWAYSTGGTIWSSPAVVAGTLFVGSSDGKLYSLDATDGSVRWSYNTGNAIFSSPAVEEGTVFFGSSDHIFYALNADTGAVKWYFETGDPITSSPCIVDGIVYFGSWDGNLYALSAGGTQKWKFKTDGAIYSSPSVSKGKVIFGSSDGKVYALDKETGELKWSFQTDDYVSPAPALTPKYVYIGSWDGNMYALEAETGKLVWKYRTGGGIYSSAAIYEETIIFGSYDGKLYCMDRYKGVLKWIYASKDSVYHSSPVVANGIAYIGLGYKNKIQAFNARTGEYLWSHPTGASVGATPAVAGSSMYIAASDGKVYAFGDMDAPEAAVKALVPAQSNYEFMVNWSGQDKGGSGIKSYDVQFRAGAGGPWQDWLTSVTTTFAVFGPKEPVEVFDNTVYYFQARAIDNAGNLGSYAGGDGDTYTVIDFTRPRITKVSVNNVVVQTGSFIPPTPIIQASISDNVSIDPESLMVIIDDTKYVPDSFANGLLKYKVKSPLLPGRHIIKVVAADVSGNKAEPWEVSGVRVSQGIKAADISVIPTPFNPIAGPAYISYRLNANAEVIIFLYDRTGSLIFSMKFEEGDNGGKRGWNKVAWNGLSGSNNMVGNGDYPFKIVANKDLVGKGQITVQK